MKSLNKNELSKNPHTFPVRTLFNTRFKHTVFGGINEPTLFNMKE